MAGEFFTWGNFFTWTFCSIMIYLSLNFRMYMIFHHPGRKLKAKARARAMARRNATEAKPDYNPVPQKPAWEHECLPNSSCYAQGRNFADKQVGSNHMSHDG